MHELAVIKSVLDTVIGHAEKHDVQKVLAVQLEVGMMSDVVEEWMQRYFNYLSKNTIAEGAELGIKWIPITFQCKECSKSFEVDRMQLDDLSCPVCGQNDFSLVSGREYVIKNMEVL